MRRMALLQTEGGNRKRRGGCRQGKCPPCPRTGVKDVSVRISGTSRYADQMEESTCLSPRGCGQTPPRIDGRHRDDLVVLDRVIIPAKGGPACPPVHVGASTNSKPYRP